MAGGSAHVRPARLAIVVMFLLLAGRLSFAAGGTVEYTGYGANCSVSGALHVLTLDGETVILNATGR